MAATKETFAATVEDAIAAAGTTQLSYLPGNADLQTVDQVKEYEEENNLIGSPVEGAHRAYAGPYTDMADGRNAWTAAQDSGDINRTKDAVPQADETDAQRREREERERKQRETTRQPSKEPPKEPAKEPQRSERK